MVQKKRKDKRNIMKQKDRGEMKHGHSSTVQDMPNPKTWVKSSPGPFHTQDRARDDLARSTHIVLDYCWRLLMHLRYLRHLRTLSLATRSCPKHGDPNPAPPHPWARADLRLRDTWEAFDVAIDTASLMMGHHWYFVLNDILIDNHQKLSTAIVLVVTYVSLLILQLEIK